MIRIHYLTSDLHKKTLELYFESQAKYKQFRFVPLPNYDFEEVECLIIAKPQRIIIENDKEYLTASTIWFKYLREKHPNIKLIIAGWACCKTKPRQSKTYKNAIDLLNLESDFSNHYKRAKTLSYYNECEERFIIPELKRGLDLEEKMLRLFDGHDNQGLTKYLTALRHTLQIATEEIELGENYTQIKEGILKQYGIKEWESLYRKWHRYRMYLSQLPFIVFGDKLYFLFEEINEFMLRIPTSPKAYEEADVLSKLNQIIKILDIEIEPYCYLEEVAQ